MNSPVRGSLMGRVTTTPGLVKKSLTPAGTVLPPPGLGLGAWVVLTLRCGCARWIELFGAGLAAVAVNRVALIWKLARMGFLTVRPETYLSPGGRLDPVRFAQGQSKRLFLPRDVRATRP